MRIFSFFVAFLLCAISLHAATDKPLDISQTDIVERTINFIIFVALMWYLLAGRIKKILAHRTKTISKTLSNAQIRVRESRDKIDRAKQKLKDANETASEIIKTAKQEALIAARHIEEKNKEQIAGMVRSNEEAMKYQERLLQKQLLTEVLNDIFASESLEISSDEYANIVRKKVS